MADKPLPKPQELEKELNDYLQRKYGDRVRLQVPFAMPAMQSGGGEGKEPAAPKAPISFSMKPRELEAYLDDYVVGQRQAKEVLATKICTHFNRIRLCEPGRTVGTIKNNVLLIGPTGVGKTYLVRLIAQRIGVPFVKADATKFSETGYVGGDVEDLVRDLVREADGDLERAQYGIIYVDEIDKIAGSNNVLGLDVSRTGVQRALLKPMEDTEVDLSVPHDMLAQMEDMEHFRRTGKRRKRTISTRHMLFIVSGAFTELEEIIQQRRNQHNIGFGATLPGSERAGELLHHVAAQDLVRYGFESEFVGRLPVVAVLDPLDADDLYQVLKNPTSTVVNSKKRDFMAYGIDLRFEDDALRELARQAADEQTGARGLVSAVERVLLRFEKELPSMDLSTLVVSAAMVRDPAAALALLRQDPASAAQPDRHAVLREAERQELCRLLRSRRPGFDAPWAALLHPPFLDAIVDITLERYLDHMRVLEDAAEVVAAVDAFETAFVDAHRLHMHFDADARAALIRHVLRDGRDTAGFLQAAFNNYQHGLQLIHERSGQDRFVLPRQAVDHPQEYLDALVKKSYH